MAVLLGESEADEFARLVAESDGCSISAVSFVEASIIAESNAGDGGLRRLDEFLRTAKVTIGAVDEECARTARQAYSEFGKGRHPAGLNLGDCFSYALAKVSGEPLLFKGNDFRQTDVRTVV
jgi:ribonuclease VapC